MIDIIIPAYNAGKTLERALSSLISQTDKNFEVYVVDDCSNDNTADIAFEYLTKLNLHYILNEKNVGCGMSRQAGMDRSSNKFIMFMDADDIMMPYAVEMMNRSIRMNPCLEFIHSSIYVQRPEGDDLVLAKEDNLYTQMHGKLYNREVLDKYNIKNNPICSRWADDSYFNSMCSELMNLSINPIPMYIWTWTEGSATHSNLNYGRTKTAIFLDAMLQSSLHILQYKDRVDHLDRTLKKFDNKTDSFSEEETELYNKLLELRR